jgi:hypothetical protein
MRMLWLAVALAALRLVLVPAGDEFTVSATVNCLNPGVGVPTVDWAIRSNVDYEGVVSETQASQRYFYLPDRTVIAPHATVHGTSTLTLPPANGIVTLRVGIQDETVNYTRYFYGSVDLNVACHYRASATFTSTCDGLLHVVLTAASDNSGKADFKIKYGEDFRTVTLAPGESERFGVFGDQAPVFTVEYKGKVIAEGSYRQAGCQGPAPGGSGGSTGGAKPLDGPAANPSATTDPSPGAGGPSESGGPVVAMPTNPSTNPDAADEPSTSSGSLVAVLGGLLASAAVLAGAAFVVIRRRRPTTPAA